MTVLTAGLSNSAAPGTLGFLVVAGMGVILVFLFRSMTKHLRKVSGNGRGDMAGSSASAPAPKTADPPWGGDPGDGRGDS